MVDTATITKIVNNFAGALIGVCKNLGISAVLDKSEISPETKAPNNRAAALIGFVTSTVNGTIGLLADEQAFGEIVTTCRSSSPCSVCYSSLIYALDRLKDKGLLGRLSEKRENQIGTGI